MKQEAHEKIISLIGDECFMLVAVLCIGFDCQAEAEQSDRKVFHLRSYFIHTVDGKRHFWICDSHLSLSPQTRSHAC